MTINNNNETAKLMTMDDEVNSRGYSLSGKIMLTAIIVLFFLVLLMLSLHLYARWYLTRARRRHNLRRNLRRRRTNIVFYIDPPTLSASQGLDPALLASIPIFTYQPKPPADHPPECAVCLSEFEPGETGRILPKCNHVFHTDCIDMWFHSHATCPLCRAPVEPQPEPETRPEEFVITVCEGETGSSSGICPQELNRNGTGNGRERRKLSPVTVEVPARNCESFRDESGGHESPPSSSSSFRSPMSRMLSFKRILSRERKGSVSPSSIAACGGGSCSSAAEVGDVERDSEKEESLKLASS
ncbi:hypothetical protein PIB30_104048 [Stylosanthes scabra]|uniref:RING-type E3 ubiquitin transferase n=1 Tax=Stylosanthes scabra TaxID=79078 RepID=A0ABU6VWK8_9FABA|nr:hypothetical protein [Stylosanthes scabra]